MRLKKLETGQRWPERLKIGLATLIFRQRVPDVVRLLWYRRDHFGKAYSALTQRVMRGPSPWTAGERELMAAFVSNKNRCPF
jgi:hypothetical protein